MKLLLDSQVFIWWRDEAKKIPKATYEKIANPDNALFLSVASVWEIQLKILLGKLKLEDPLEQALLNEKEANNLFLLPIATSHIFGLERLPAIHKDPFDRLLISQAIYEELTLITSDKTIADYDVRVLW